MWKRILRLGITDQMDEGQKKQLIILNLINILLVLLFSFTIILYTYSTEHLTNAYGFDFYRLFLIVFAGIFHLFLNHIGKYFLSKTLLLIDIPILLFVSPIFMREIREIQFFIFPYIIILFSIIPHFVYTKNKEIKWVYLILLIYLIFQSSIYEILSIAALKELSIIPIIEANYIFYHFTPIMIFVFINGSLLYTFKINRIHLVQIESAGIELSNQQEELKAQNEELVVLNEESVFKTKKLEELNKTLTDSNATKELFLKIIGHDLQAPIAQINVFVDFIIDQFTVIEQDDLLKHLKSISISSNNVSRLIENILEWSKLQAGKVAFLPENFDLKSLANECIEFLASKAADKKISIHNLIVSETMVFADKNMINTVLRNLISNALKFTNENGKIELSTINNENNTEVLISDNGVGMEKDESEKLFSLDLKKSTPGTNNEKGSGIGLLICKEFVEKHQSKIWVESEKGNGSTFHLLIPHVFQN